MAKFLIPLFLCLAQYSSGQSIVSAPFIVNGVITLGQHASVQFTVNQQTLCDSYIVSYDINHVGKIVNVNVDYNYISSCGESFVAFTEIPSSQFVLTGVYTVFINVNVATNPAWNSQTVLGSISVIEPNNVSCASGFIPFLEGFCPSFGNPVCACDGIDYANECQAYLEGQNGVYEYQSCEQIFGQKVVPFSCDQFFPNTPNFFEKYSCSNAIYPGDEIVFVYEHDATATTELSFTSQNSSVCLFLMGLGNGGLSCIQKSVNNILDLSFLESGTYYLLADGSGAVDIEFCTTTATSSLRDNGFNIYPNPATDYVEIRNDDSTIKEILIMDMLGRCIKSHSVIQKDIRVNTEDLNGTYVFQIQLKDGSLHSEKISINR